MISKRGRQIADEIDGLNVGQTVHINDHEITRLERETEVYSVDGREVCFVKAWDIVHCPALENRIA